MDCVNRAKCVLRTTYEYLSCSILMYLISLIVFLLVCKFSKVTTHQKLESIAGQEFPIIPLHFEIIGNSDEDMCCI